SSGGAKELQERVRQWNADLELITHLHEAIVSGIPADPQVQGDLPIIPSFEASFRNYGIDHESTPAASAAERIRCRPTQIQLAIIEALDVWADLQSKNGRYLQHYAEKQRWLKAVIESVDTDPWRIRMRKSLERSDYATLVELAGSPEISKQAPYTLARLGVLL